MSWSWPLGTRMSSRRPSRTRRRALALQHSTTRPLMGMLRGIPLGASVRKEPREESRGTVCTVRKGRPLVQKVRTVQPCDPPKQAKNPRAPRHRAPTQQRNVVPTARTNRALHRDVRHQQRANRATTRGAERAVRKRLPVVQSVRSHNDLVHAKSAGPGNRKSHCDW